MEKIKSVCVFCGASDNIDQKYKDVAFKVGEAIAENNLKMIFGNGVCGMMGAAANGALSKNAHVTGVFPKVLFGLEGIHEGVTETIIVEDMHTRKMNMFQKSDAFIILPGGFGTMDETFEVISWKQINTHKKPIIIYNFEGYWDSWIKLTDNFIEKNFAAKDTKTLYKIADSIDDIFLKLSEK